MTVNRIKNKKRSSLRKKIIPLVLALAVIFSTVMASGFAKWQDTLTLTANVTVKKQSAKITNITKKDAYDCEEEDYFEHLKYGDENENWVCYHNFTKRYFIVPYRDVLAYAIPLTLSGQNTANATATINNRTLDSTGYDSDRTSTDSYGGTYYMYFKSSETRGFSSGQRPLDSGIVDEDGDYGFHQTSGIPMTVTVSNPNGEVITLSGFSVSVSGAASVSVSSLTVPANGTATFNITPLRTSGAYQSFSVTFSDDSGNNYSVSVNIAT